MLQINLLKNNTINLKGEKLPALSSVNQLIEDHYSWALKRITRLYYRLRIPPHMREDVRAQALLSLTLAAHRFDPDKDTSFRTYASHYIRGAFFEELRRSKRRNREVSYVAPQGIDQSGSSGETDSTDKGSSTTMCYFKAAGSEGQRAPDDNINSDYFISQKRADDFLKNKRLATALKAALEKLPEKDRYVISSYYFKDMSMKQIGEVMGVRVSWVSRIHRRALQKLRKEL